MVSENPEQTMNLGIKLASIIKNDSRYFSQIILLNGDLGAGKTVFVKGLAQGLELGEEITSPTFNLINEYEGKPGLIHMDFYRLDKKDELIQIGFEEYLNRDVVKAIEWPQLVFDYIGDEFIFIKMTNLTESKREVIIEAEGEKSKNILEGLHNYDSIRD
ncbi:MAG: tRNA (adenosine(37)-N6)-threonylcarbamoyltransferase complex ATPase subunit type 1 TsaE [Halanaerobiales bacterium]